MVKVLLKILVVGVLITYVCCDEESGSADTEEYEDDGVDGEDGEEEDCEEEEVRTADLPTLSPKEWEEIMGDQKEVKPHIIVIHADDLGHGDVSFNSEYSVIETPNLDFLAGEGIVLDSHYTLPTCSPSRSAFLTGRYPYKMGTQHGDISDYTPHCAPLDIPFISERLSEGGYQTHLAGKWHLGACQEACTPMSRGFDTAFGPLNGKQDQLTHISNGGFDWMDNGQPYPDAIDEYSTHLIKNRSVDIINNYSPGDKPMFLWVSFTAPQDGQQTPREYTAQYDLEDTMSDERKNYLGAVTALDEAVGEIADALMENDMWGDSVFLFSSDNGGNYGGVANNYPLRGSQGTLYEGGTKVPTIFSGGKVPVDYYGIRHGGMIHIVDWVPTFLEMAGIKYDPDEFDGVNQTHMILDYEDSARSEFIYNIDLEPSDTVFMGNAAIRRNNMKFIWGFPGVSDGHELQNRDPVWLIDDYLGVINKSVHDFDGLEGDELRVRQEEYRKELAEFMGIYDLTEDNMDRGYLALYNILEDPTESFNLAFDDKYKDLVQEFKEEIMQRINDGYFKPPLTADERWEVDPTGNEGSAWTPNWCTALNMSLPFSRD